LDLEEQEKAQQPVSNYSYVKNFNRIITSTVSS
jgi:hypothetical protein